MATTKKSLTITKVLATILATRTCRPRSEKNFMCQENLMKIAIKQSKFFKETKMSTLHCMFKGLASTR